MYLSTPLPLWLSAARSKSCQTVFMRNNTQFNILGKITAPNFETVAHTIKLTVGEDFGIFKAMKKGLVLFSTLLIFVVVALAVLVIPAEARVVYDRENPVALGSAEVVDDDLFIAATQVAIRGTVNGDVFVAGGSVAIEGTINGDVYAAGGLVTVTGKVSQDLVVLGGNVNLSGAEVGDGVIAGAGQLDISSDTKIGGGLIFAGGWGILSGEVGRNVVGGCGRLLLDGSVGRSVYVGASVLNVDSAARIGGSLTYRAGKSESISSAAEIKGGLNKVSGTAPRKGWRFSLKNFGLAGYVYSYVSSLVVGIILVYFFRFQVERVAETVLIQPWRSLGLGFLVLFLTPVAVIIFLASVVGIPIGLIIFALWMLSIYLTHFFISYLFGDSLAGLLKDRSLNPYLVMALGLLVYQLLGLIPIFNFFIGLATILFGLGALFSYQREVISAARATS